jgi:hypothetical protein
MRTKTFLLLFANFVVLAVVLFTLYYFISNNEQTGPSGSIVPENAPIETIELFNGNNLDGWGFVLKDATVKDTDVFTVKDGVIDIAGEPFGYMFTEKEFSNFRLHVEWRWPQEATNSGIFLLVQDDRKVWPNAIECQLKAGDAGSMVLLGGSDLAEFILPKGQERPEYPVVTKKKESSENPTGEWNSADITSENGTLTLYINGIFQNQGFNTQHKQGRIGLQSEGKEIQFRNIRITPQN